MSLSLHPHPLYIILIISKIYLEELNEALVLCPRPSDPWLAGADLVLQSEYKEQRDIVNSIMASVPGHPFWKLIIGRMLSVRALLVLLQHPPSTELEGTSPLQLNCSSPRRWVELLQHLYTSMQSVPGPSEA